MHAEKLKDLETRSKNSNNPLTIYDTDDAETREHKLAMIDEMIRASGQDLEYE